MIQARCSRLPLLSACPAAQVAPSIRIEGDDRPARLGTATHDINASMIAGYNRDIFEVAAENNVPADELGVLVGMSRKMWTDLAGQFPEPMCEQPMEYADNDLTLTGTADIYAEAGEEIRIGDWKTGHRTEHDAREQLKGYAFLALAIAKTFNRVRVYTIFVRDQRVDVDLFERSELMRWWEWLKGHLKDSETYRPGPHCANCPRVRECPGHAEQIESFSNALARGYPERGTQLHDQAAIGVQLSRLLRKRCEEFEAAVKVEVSARGGRWGNLVLKTTHPKSIDVARAMPHMIEELSESQVLPLLDVSKTKLEATVKANSPRGQKGKAWNEFMERLEAVGAITETERTTLEVERDYGNSNAIEAAEPSTANAVK